MRFPVVALAALFLAAPALPAQAWNDARSRALVELATERRARQLADTALTDYKAQARGFLTFLAQLGEGFTEPPKIIKADELALDVYWKAPNLSKQLIYGRRDTLLLPTDISYHRDHLGIVQNNFPGIIRLGDGDEVRDVPHPLSASGLAEYDFAIRDSLQIRLGPRTLDVYEVRVRPRNDRAPRAVGALFIDRESGELVRMALSFTRAALRDRDLDDVSVVLENGLIEGRFWLPRRQEIEIRRSGSWLDYPARGIIRGRWEICCYEVNRGLSAGFFAGPEIALAPRRTGAPPAFSGSILDSLPADVRATTDEDVRKVQEEARALVRSQALNRTRAASLSARRASDFVRVNRVEGLALGQGLRFRLGGGVSVEGHGRYGFSDHRAKGDASLVYQRASGTSLRLSAYSGFREAGDVAERSLAVNSIAAQEFGSDYTNPFSAKGVSVGATLPPFGGWIPGLDMRAERQGALAVNARPANGAYEPTLDADAVRLLDFGVSVQRPSVRASGGFDVRAHLSARAVVLSGDAPAGRRESFGRLSGTLDMERASAGGRLVLRTVGALVSSRAAPVQYQVFMGGPITAPGYDFHSITGVASLSQRAEWRFPVPVPTLSLGRYGRTPARAPLAPYANLVGVSRGSDPLLPVPAGRPPRDSFYPSIGVGFLPLFELVRLDVARGLRDGRWSFQVDVSRDFWPIL